MSAKKRPHLPVAGGGDAARCRATLETDANFSADDIKRLRHQPAANKTPFVHTVLQKQHYWARMPTKYRLIGPMDRLKLAPGMN